MIESTRSISSVIGQAFHSAMETYYTTISDDQDAIKAGLQQGMDFLEGYNPNFIEFTKDCPTIQKAQERFTFVYTEYIKYESDKDDKIISCEDFIEEYVNVEYQNKTVSLPIKLKGYIDKVVQSPDGKMRIVDYKTARAFSDPDKIDGVKIIQAVQYYFLVYAKYGIPPYSMVYKEVKTTRNRDGSPQVREYEMVYEENPLFFDLYFRLYNDTTRALTGKAVFVPNLRDMFDNEISIIAYIHGLDNSEELAQQMKKARVDNITQLLKKKLHNTANMNKFMQTIKKKFISHKTLNYNAMSSHEKIATKLMEHGMMIHFEDVIHGANVDLYRYTPSVGLKMSKIKSFVSDIEQVVGRAGVRVLAPIPNTTYIGFEVPKAEREFPKDMPKADGFSLAIGIDVMGDPYNFDVREAPHMLVAGATGSGKSVFLNSIIQQLIGKCELWLLDPKMVELVQFKSQAKVHATAPLDIHAQISTLVAIMNKRYAEMAKRGVRSIAEIDNMPYIFCVVDEFGDLIVGNHMREDIVETGEMYKDGTPKTKIVKTNISKEIERMILILAQKARAAGIHLIIATQRPSTDIITGSIKANFPTKVAFRCAKAIDSVVVLGEDGAERLLGKGDMIFSCDKEDIRLQGYNA